MSTETAAPLEIPNEAYAAAREAVREDGIRGAGAFVTAPDAILAAAPIIVATELRRLADLSADDAARIKRGLPADRDLWSNLDRIDQGRVFAYEDEARALRARADELTGAGDA